MLGYRSLAIGAALLLSACASRSHPDGTGAAPYAGAAATRSVPEPARQVTLLADEYFADWLRTFPVSATFNGVAEASSAGLEDNAIPAIRAWERKEDAWIARLKQVRAESLRGRPEDATYGVLLETLENSRQGRVCRPELMALNQQSGWHILLAVLGQIQPVGTPELRQAALARWHRVPRYIDNEIANLRVGLEDGYTQPQGNAKAVLEQLNQILAIPAERSPFAGPAARDSTPGFRDSVVAVVSQEILPATIRYRDFLQREYIPKARSSTALSAVPRGAECYRARVRQYTTANLDAGSVHRLGLEQMAAIEKEARPLARKALGSSDLPAVYQRMRTDSSLTFRSRDEIVRTAEEAIARAKAAMPKWFGRLPKGDVIVAPCAAFEEKNGCPNSYVPGTPDGKRPGRWRINAASNPPQPRASHEGTAFHETIPGHHLQFAIAQEREQAHPVTRYFFFSGFSEGWALYAERLADEMGLYSDDLSRLGDLGNQALRAARLVVDPGLAVLGWSRQQAIDYMLAHVPMSRDVAESEVDRYIADPGQATAYMIGRLEIERLRKESEARLGNKFDIRQFHDRVLESGSVPLPFLREHIEAWLAS